MMKCSLVFGVLVFAVASTFAVPQVRMQIQGKGELIIELYPEKAPKTVARFLQLVKSNFYDGVRFHRVENNPRPFIIVTGDPFSKNFNLDDARVGTGGSGTKIPFEKNDILFLDGTLGMVRDINDPDSADSQFFICNGNQRFLEGTYVAFARVVKGLEVIPKIARGDTVVSIRVIE
jgi:cyclophilin family peptidyl-prolyl cis-trans isomerase